MRWYIYCTCRYVCCNLWGLLWNQLENLVYYNIVTGLILRRNQIRKPLGYTYWTSPQLGKKLLFGCFNFLAWFLYVQNGFTYISLCLLMLMLSLSSKLRVCSSIDLFWTTRLSLRRECPLLQAETTWQTIINFSGTLCALWT